MADIPSPSNDGWKNPIVLAVIWLAAIGALFSSSTIRDAIFSGFRSTKTDNFSDVIVINQNGETRNTAFHAKERADINSIIQSPTNSRTFFAGTASGLFVSNDSGNNWFPIGLPESIGKDAVIYNLSTNPQNPFEISMVIVKDNQATIYKTTDNFFSIQKAFEINSDQLKALAVDRSFSTAISTGGLNIIGTRK